jgi:methyl-accepting chemotaxis protein
MDNNSLLVIFIAITAFAVLLQAGLLAGMYLAMRKSTTKMEALAEELKAKALPALDTVQTVLAEIKPKVEEIVENVKDTSSSVRDEVHRVEATVNDVVDRARLQIIRLDEMLTRTFDRVEHTSDVVQKTVMSPVRQVTGVIHGVTAGFEFLLGNRGRKNGGARERRPVPQDEMFI